MLTFNRLHYKISLSKQQQSSSYLFLNDVIMETFHPLLVVISGYNTLNCCASPIVNSVYSMPRCKQ